MVCLYSVDDERAPQQTGIIRAESPFTTWTFRAVNPCAVSTSIDRTHSDARGNPLDRLISCIKGEVFLKQHGILKCFSRKGSRSLQTNEHIAVSDGQRHQLTSIEDSDLSSQRVRSIGGPADGGLSALWCSQDGVRRTIITIESFVDSKGSIPAWFINYMQR